MTTTTNLNNTAWYTKHCGKPIKNWLTIDGAVKAFDDAVKLGNLTLQDQDGIVIREYVDRNILRFFSTPEDAKKGIPDDPCKCVGAISAPRTLSRPPFNWPKIIGRCVDFNQAFFLTEDLVIVRTLINQTVQRENDMANDAGLREILIKPVSASQQIAKKRKSARKAYDKRKSRKKNGLSSDKHPEGQDMGAGAKPSKAQPEASGLREAGAIRHGRDVIPIVEAVTKKPTKPKLTRSDHIRNDAKNIRDLLRRSRD